ncbi:10644_t:CDS:2, partial [Cetraspora pellucida]
PVNEELASEELVSKELVGKELASKELASEELVGKELASEESASEELVSKELASEELVSKELANEELMSKELASEELVSKELTSEELMSKELSSEELVSKELAEGGLMNKELIYKPLDTTHFKNDDEWEKLTEFHENIFNDDYDSGYEIVAVKSLHDSSDDLKFLDEIIPTLQTKFERHPDAIYKSKFTSTKQLSSLLSLDTEYLTDSHYEIFDVSE